AFSFFPPWGYSPNFNYKSNVNDYNTFNFTFLSHLVQPVLYRRKGLVPDSLICSKSRKVYIVNIFVA
ncbi:MAG: hypothetical protein IKO38_10920, partial [Erysipelotrichaceae bacterium]|nr:hypothetical protein [Erysipelotrichaceae bacterium]